MIIKVKSGKKGIEIKQEEDRIFMSGTWNGRTEKSKKGNWNIFWSNKELFDEAIKKYLDGDESVEGEEEEVPF